MNKKTNKPMFLFSFFKNYRFLSIKRRLKSKLIIKELLENFNKNNEIPFEKVIEIVFELQIPPNYTNLPDSYSIEIRRYYLRLNTTIVFISDLIHQCYETSQEITETSKKDNELIKKREELEEALKPLISQLLDVIKSIKKEDLISKKN